MNDSNRAKKKQRASSIFSGHLEENFDSESVKFAQTKLTGATGDSGSAVSHSKGKSK